jgi:hypothetical protein
MNHTKPKPVGRVMPSCPVCGKASYSRDGIHPQCASQRADDAVRAAQKKAEPKAKATNVTEQPRRQWMKLCVRCQRQVPARSAVCECGFCFPKKLA